MKLFNRFAAVALVGGLSVVGAETVSAAPIMVSFNIAALGTFTADTGDVTTATTITNGAPLVVGAIVLNNVGLVGGQSVTLAPNPLGVTVGSVFTKSFTTVLGTFLETLTVTSVDVGVNARGVVAQGMIVQTVGAGFDPTSVFFSAAYTQNTGPQGGFQINGSFNNSTTPPRQVPEPATMALMGLGLLGAGIARRRK